jgi:hypothetical protein
MVSHSPGSAAFILLLHIIDLALNFLPSRPVTVACIKQKG